MHPAQINKHNVVDAKLHLHREWKMSS